MSRLARLPPPDWALIAGIGLLALLLRALSPITVDLSAWPPVKSAGYGALQPPVDGYVFDERYFATDACKDIAGADYADPEPPLGKLLIAAGIVAGSGFRAAAGSPTEAAAGGCILRGSLPGYDPWTWRLASLVFGTGLVVLVYLLALALWPSRFFASVAAFLVALDGLAMVQSRLAMIDTFPVFFVVLSYLVFLHHRRASSRPAYVATGVALGISLGLAAASKWTGLAAWGGIVVLLAGEWVLARTEISSAVSGWRLGSLDVRGRTSAGWAWGRLAFRVAVLLALPALVYLLAYARYVSFDHVLPEVLAANPCDLSHPRTVVAAHDVGAWVASVWQHDRWAFAYHSCFRLRDPNGSPWFSWPFLLHPTIYLVEPGVQRLEVWNLGNPALWWASIPALVYCLVHALRARSHAAGLIVVAFLVAWLPFSRVDRVLYLYHMLGGLPFMALAVAFAAARMRTGAILVRARGFEPWELRGSLVVGAYLAAVVALFLFFYPLWVGAPITEAEWQQRMWLSLPDLRVSWR